MNLYNCHCHQIIFASGRYSDYSNLLQEAIKQPQACEHITLLDVGVSTVELGHVRNELRTTRFEGVFQDRLKSKGPPPTVTALPLPALTRVESNGTAATCSSPATPAMTWAALSAAPFVPAAKAAPVRSPEPAHVASTTPDIEKNRLGQRVDRLDSSIPREEVHRIKKLKLCNVFFLLGADACTNPNCTHDHDYPLTREERKVLSEVARMTPCYYMTECEDPKCIYGHRCPQSKPDDKDCWYKENCRFWDWGHGIDIRVVKTLVVGSGKSL